jgi:hypothetical protein
MNLELLNTLAAVGTFVVIAASAIAAAIQLQHLRQNNKLQAVLALRSERTPELVAAFEFVATQLKTKLGDPVYRRELEGFAPSREAHQELVLADYFEHIGAYMKRGLLDEDIYFEIASPERYWKLVEPAIAIYRRSRDSTAFENFEYLVVRAQKYDREHPSGTYPKNEERLMLMDPYFEVDAK